MTMTLTADEALRPESADYYRATLRLLYRSKIPYMVGGAYALAHYTGIVRHTKDLDIFLRPDDAPQLLDYLAGHGYRTEMTFPHWLGKAFLGDDFIDLIFSGGNGIARIDDDWFRYASAGELLGKKVRFCPVEESIWSKSFICERERFDGADINHLIHSRGPELDWQRLLRRFGENWRVLLSHLTLYGYVYPAERDRVPTWVMDELTLRLRDETHTEPPATHTCRGPLLSRLQYLKDLKDDGYDDARVRPEGTMSRGEVRRWTQAGIDEAE